MTPSLDRRLSVAPMMDWTDRHTRYFHRLLTRRTLLYTEMITTGALIHGDRDRFLAYDVAEHPVALQLGGCDPADLAACARMGAAWGYDEINLNIGCPSDRVQNARFGACLMAEPALVARCVAAMAEAADTVPVTVKCRIGIDERDSYDQFRAFVDALDGTGCRSIAVHARKAWLSGLSPKQNREVPPLRYDYVHRLKAERPALHVVLNGGVQDLDRALEHLRHADGVMIGRAAYQDPWILAEADRRVFGDDAPLPDRMAVVAALAAYVERRMGEGVPLKSMTRHYLGLFNGLPGARAWRRLLSEEAHLPGAGPDLLIRAADRIAASPSVPATDSTPQASVPARP